MICLMEACIMKAQRGACNRLRNVIKFIDTTHVEHPLHAHAAKHIVVIDHAALASDAWHAAPLSSRQCLSRRAGPLLLYCSLLSLLLLFVISKLAGCSCGGDQVFDVLDMGRFLQLHQMLGKLRPLFNFPLSLCLLDHDVTVALKWCSGPSHDTGASGARGLSAG